MYEDKELDELKEIAVRLAMDNQWDELAIEVNSRIIENAVNYIPAYTRLAKCLLNKGDSAGALKLYKKIVKADPDNKIANNHIKSVRFRLEREDKEIERIKMLEVNKKVRDEKRKSREKVDSYLKSIL